MVGERYGDKKGRDAVCTKPGWGEMLKLTRASIVVCAVVVVLVVVLLVAIFLSSY